MAHSTARTSSGGMSENGQAPPLSSPSPTPSTSDSPRDQLVLREEPAISAGEGSRPFVLSQHVAPLAEPQASLTLVHAPHYHWQATSVQSGADSEARAVIDRMA